MRPNLDKQFDANILTPFRNDLHSVMYQLP